MYMQAASWLIGSTTMILSTIHVGPSTDKGVYANLMPEIKKRGFWSELIILLKAKFYGSPAMKEYMRPTFCPHKIGKSP